MANDLESGNQRSGKHLRLVAPRRTVLRHRYYFRPGRLVRFGTTVPGGEIRVNEDWAPLNETEHPGQGEEFTTRSQVFSLVIKLDQQAEIARGDHVGGVPLSVLDYPDCIPDFDAPTRPGT
jgi:hypothetical protein